MKKQEKRNSGLQEKYDTLQNLLTYLTREINKYIYDLKSQLMNVSEEIEFISSMIVYLDKEREEVIREIKVIRRKLFYEESE